MMPAEVILVSTSETEGALLEWGSWPLLTQTYNLAFSSLSFTPLKPAYFCGLSMSAVFHGAI